ncbi:S41 family peptidase [Nitrospirillum iridis]|uniref:Tail specific protease domain-containing protein n=1 Tax=Nitrospirillum iridis TaxID=765888 RepID=A0A7X0AVZ0_9PROT|nr:S41 family peptidase [Nitrospirillum iridis]MBB6249666.1 hypothetical protein [Nitrospirillum iridis]
MRLPPFLGPLTLACILTLAPPAVAAPDAGPAYAPLSLSPAQARADVALLRRALETIHPGLYRYGTRAEVDQAFARLEGAAAQPMTDLELWRAIATLVAAIHCDHTKPEPSAAIEDWRTRHPTHLPLRFTLVEGRMIVVSNDGQPGAPPPGAEITAINGRPVPTVLATLGQAVAYDGDTTQAIAVKLAVDSDLMGDDLDEYWPAFYGFPDHWTLEWKRPGDSRLSQATLAPIPFRQWMALAWPETSYRDEFYKAVTWRLAGKTAYLRIDTLVNYRNPVDPTAFLAGFFRILKQRGVERLILDLRNNGGGSEDVSVALGRYLLPHPFTWSKPPLLKAVRYGDLPAHMETWGDPKALFEPAMEGFSRTAALGWADGWWQRLPRDGNPDDEGLWPQEPSPDHFTGALVVLTGPRNGSGATRIIAQLRDKTGARLVGEDTSGSAEGPTAGHIFLLTLPNSGIRVRIPNAWNRTNLDNPAPTGGVAVDDRVTPTMADQLAGLDRALAVAKASASTPDPAPGLAGALAGDWTGTLDYRDYGSDRRVILPTRLSVTTDGGTARLSFTYDDGPGKTVRSQETWSLEGDGQALVMDDGERHQRYDVLERRGGPGPGDLTLVAQGTGVENGHPVGLRVILARRGGTVSVTTLSAGPGQPYLMRHAYWLSHP